MLNHRLAIPKLPVSRFLGYLVESGNYECYMNKLMQAYNAPWPPM